MYVDNKLTRCFENEQASPIKAETDAEEPKTEQGNTSMDTGVSSDLSESRRSLVEDDLDDEMEEEESGGEFEERRRDGKRYEDDRLSIVGGRKRQLDDHLDGDSRCHPIAKQRITAASDAQSASMAAEGAQLRCPECVQSFASRAHLIQHVQMAHPATLAYHAAVLAGAGKDLADMPSILHLANAAALAAAANSGGRPVNNLFAGLERDVTNADDEYKNEEDDPFSAVLREMKMKGEFPCRLCEAVFPNLRALKGKTHSTCTISEVN